LSAGQKAARVAYDYEQDEIEEGCGRQLGLENKRGRSAILELTHSPFSMAGRGSVGGQTPDVISFRRGERIMLETPR